MGLLLLNSSNNPMSSVRPFNLGLHFFGFKSCVFSSVCGQIWQKNWGLMTLGQVKSVPNFS